MILIFSDLHIGREPENDAVMVNELYNCLSRELDHLKEVIFLGDLFDAWLEYAHRIPPVYMEFRPVLKYLQDNDIRVTYVVGNHDSWHLDFFEDIAGVNMIRRATLLEIDGIRTYLSHGDEFDAQSPFSRMMRDLMRSEWSFLLYRVTLPAKIGQPLPAWISRKFGGRGKKNATIRELREAAMDLLEEDDIDRVIMGHTHTSCIEQSSSGSYVNTGSWFSDRTFAELSGGQVRLRRYTGVRPV